jgi:alkyl sulfatase BDS1-like metallo-beta-lactamase superfamily hydrolase
MTAAVLALLACSPDPEPPSAAPAASDLGFSQGFREVVPGAWMASGFGLANVLVLEGPEGLVVVDTMEGRGPATQVLAAIRQELSAPIAAVVLTHNHPDHSFGGKVFVEAGGAGTPVWAHARTAPELFNLLSVVREAISIRSMRMFGMALPPGEHEGIGLQLRLEQDDIALAWPTHTVDTRTPVRLAGLDLELLPIPGETDDQLAVWWPERRVLLPGDNIYEAFPNLTTIRGTSYRDVRAWVASLDVLRSLGAEAVLPSHTGPLVGAAQVEETLTAYRDAIQFVHDQTIRAMNHGRTPDQIAAELRLPPALASHPWLVERYGTVATSARGIYAGYLGWFDGDGSRLVPLPPDERARRYAKAMAEGEGLPVQVGRALEAGEHAWAAELARWWTQAEPESAEAREALAKALEGLAARTINAPERNWYLTQAGELRGEISLRVAAPGENPRDLIDDLPIEAYMNALPTRLKAEDALDTDLVVGWEFTDVGRSWRMHIRRGIAELQERPADDASLRFVTTSVAWKRIAGGHLTPAAAVVEGELSVEGGVTSVLAFRRLFDQPGE